ncbi:YebC/PmpR family DNA-binding transcriptional regulator [Brevundimonas terrae]|jgi:YebC/PmpR family DNA-binding regulatory protein|uniref:Probable transcriptional regulatory protein GCM10009093_12920 n=1 Tax=Brevundimonas terrae TaxID=363631 RepID=A0ABP3I1P0_9CAUL|nr:YebC/PmpR family DNA-binding transcriptional regulator [Brevundimonas terrae]NIJ27716.1 YebC/PmpR family DNA-binding regulatory protein [Brevundimonas terrae]
MAGHSKFKNIMHRKGRADKLRAKLFSRLSREITVAAKSGMPDPSMNPRLRLAVNNAKAESMPKENIERAIKKAAGGEVDAMEEIRYEGRGPGGVQIVVDVLTDNRNRAASNIRTAFSKNGGALGEAGSVTFMWDRVGQITYPAEAGTEDAVMEAAIEAGASDVESDLVKPDIYEDAPGHTIWTAFEDLNDVAEAMSKVLGDPKSTAIVWKPQSEIELTGESVGTLFKLLDALDAEDDVQQVYSNEDISDEDAAKYAG